MTKLSLLVLLASTTLYSCKTANNPSAEKSESPQTEEEAKLAATIAEDPTAPAHAGMPELAAAPALLAAPLGLPPTPSPDHNLTTADKVALGKLLFSDPMLSLLESKMSCATCHQPDSAFSSSVAADTNADGSLNQRHTPSLQNIGYHSEFYWDGRSSPLEAHILSHWPGQLGDKVESAVARIAKLPRYRAHFLRSFKSEPSPNRAAEAIASYLRSIRTGNSSWDQYEAGKSDAVDVDIIAGAKVFSERAGCARCHQPPLYTDLGYHAVATVNRQESDPGRFGASGKKPDKGAFKTPTLRGLSQSAPYFHNGSAATLEDVLAAKEASGSPKLSEVEKKQLIAFLRSLSNAPGLGANESAN